MIIEEEVYLEHFGVRGMKWGVRTSKPSSAANSKFMKEVMRENNKALADLGYPKQKVQLRESRPARTSSAVGRGTVKTAKAIGRGSVPVAKAVGRGTKKVFNWTRKNPKTAAKIAAGAAFAAFIIRGQIKGKLDARNATKLAEQMKTEHWRRVADAGIAWRTDSSHPWNYGMQLSPDPHTLKWK